MTCITTTKFSFYCLFNFVSKSGHYLIWLQTYRCLRKYKVNLSEKSFGVAKRHNDIRIDLRQCWFVYNFNAFALKNATKIVFYVITLRDSNTIGENCYDCKYFYIGYFSLHFCPIIHSTTSIFRARAAS